MPHDFSKLRPQSRVTFIRDPLRIRLLHLVAFIVCHVLRDSRRSTTVSECGDLEFVRALRVASVPQSALAGCRKYGVSVQTGQKTAKKFPSKTIRYSIRSAPTPGYNANRYPFRLSKKIKLAWIYPVHAGLQGMRYLNRIPVTIDHFVDEIENIHCPIGLFVLVQNKYQAGSQLPIPILG